MGGRGGRGIVCIGWTLLGVPVVEVTTAAFQAVDLGEKPSGNCYDLSRAVFGGMLCFGGIGSCI